MTYKEGQIFIGERMVALSNQFMIQLQISNHFFVFLYIVVLFVFMEQIKGGRSMHPPKFKIDIKHDGL